MPRSRSSGGRLSRPSAPSRGMHTATAPPPSYSAPPPVASAGVQQPSMFAQMATTAAGVAVGSAVGHTLANGVSSLFGSGSSEVAQPQQQQYAQTTQQPAYNNQSNEMCKSSSDDFMKCLNATNDVSQCQFYLDQLNSCRSAMKNF
ncbi:hypothetical protein IWW56_004993 [Coemansia sp. RSA 2131]|nr:hypothetical protein IWW56_004993 [Coemansia sp. RSA 2131]